MPRDLPRRFIPPLPGMRIVPPTDQATHDRFHADMDDALAEIAERQEPKPECPLCRGYGWLMATDPHKPWNEHKTQCWECG